MKRKTTKGTNGSAVPAPEQNATNQRQLSPDEMTCAILTHIRQFEPELQNSIIMVVLKELSIDRKNAYVDSRNEHNRCMKNHEEFCAILNNADTKL